MKKGTREGRRLFAACVAVGVVVGVIAGALAAAAFHSNAEYQPCKPDDPTNFDECRILDVAGFHLHSVWNAGVTVGGLVGVVGWVVTVVAVLYSTGHQHHHQEL
jgi:hypothetical protein